jgi:hypothetical protein
MPSKVQLPLRIFTLPSGSPVANGYLMIRLSIPGSVNDTQIQSNFVKVPLDSTGTVIGTPTFWHNTDISPPGTSYIQSVYTSQGQLISGPNKLTI